MMKWAKERLDALLVTAGGENVAPAPIEDDLKAQIEALGGKLEPMLPPTEENTQ